MTWRSDRKLNQLQQDLPEGLLVDAAWLEAKGYSSALRSHYVSAGWLNNPARRVYRRSHRPLTWEQVVGSLQTLLERDLTVGGRTALEDQGYAHYLDADRREVFLYGPRRPPTWITALPLAAQFRWRNSLRLFPDRDPTPPPPDAIMVSSQGAWIGVRYSSKERAVFELLDELPNHESFHQVDALFGGLSDLSPRKLQTLLGHCASVKVKRLFLFFADRHRHAWRTKLDTTLVNLGSGKRELTKGGRLDSHYNITVPTDMESQ